MLYCCDVVIGECVSDQLAYANICSGVGFKRFVFDLATRNGGNAEFDVVGVSCGWSDFSNAQ